MLSIASPMVILVTVALLVVAVAEPILHGINNGGQSGERKLGCDNSQ